LNQPSPALIAQAAVRRLPRLALLLFCGAYVLPGFFGRGPWKNEDIAGFGVMSELVSTGSNWLMPQLLGQTTGFDALLPYWLGALFIKALPFLDPAVAVRLPFVLLLGLTLLCTWYATYYLARSPRAQPVAFAFGGEASPVDYARSMADASLLALIACLGLAQLSHETTPALAQISFVSMIYYALAASPYRAANQRMGLLTALVAGLAGLTLSGAPTLAVILGLGGAGVEYLQRFSRQNGQHTSRSESAPPSSPQWLTAILLTTILVALLAWVLDLWRWRIELPGDTELSAWTEWRKLGRLLLWFTWPAWPLALITLWRWRRQLTSRHVALPLWFSGTAVVVTLTTTASDRSLLLGLPPLATLAAFALPTLKRSVASLIDWFTLLFFTSCAIAIWVIWIAMQTGVPRQPAANVAKLAPGFEPSFSWFAFAIALTATLAWAWLVRWRTGRHRAAIWKSLVLPAGGTTLCWLLLMTLWLPLLDYARSDAPLSRKIASLVDRKSCVAIFGVASPLAAALQYHGGLTLRQTTLQAQCPYLVVDAAAQARLSDVVSLPDWAFQATVRRPTDKNQVLQVYKRVTPVLPATAAQPSR
jgi:4-amino-4-deoxy-L-arabinose transferase-like glycosyltransferase